MLKTSLVIAASVLTAASILGGTAAPAFAQPAAAAPTRVVSYADLNLSSAAGRAVLDSRLNAAVRDVCGQAYPIDLNSVGQVVQCRQETLAAANAQLRRGEVLIAVRAGAAPVVTFNR